MKYTIFIFLFLIACIPNIEKDNVQNAVARVLMRDLFTGIVVGSAEINLPFSLQNVPEKITLPIPRSIRKNTSSSVRSNLQQGNGYSVFSDSISKVSELISNSMRDQILLDQLYSIAREKPNECIAGNTIQVRFTAEMLDYIRRSFLDFGYTEAESYQQLKLLQNNKKLPQEGDSVPGPAVLYSNNNEYDHQFDYTIGDRISDIVACPDRNLFQKRLSFSGNRQKLLYRLNYTTSSLDSILNIYAELTLDSSNKIMKMDIDTKQIQNSIETGIANSIYLEECESTSNCLLVRSLSQIFYPKNPLQISGMDPSLSLTEKDVYTIIEGRIDIEGGFLKTEISNKPSGTSYQYRELFNEIGTLIYYENYNHNTWSPYLSYPGLPTEHKYSDFQLSIQKNTKSTLSDIKIIAAKFDVPPYPGGTDVLGGDDIQFDIFVITKPNCDPNLYSYCIVGKGNREALVMQTPFPEVEDIFSKFVYYGIITEAIGASVWRIECCNPQWSLKYTKLKNPVGLQKTVSLKEPVSFIEPFFIITQKSCDPNTGLTDCILGTGKIGENPFLNYYDYGLVNSISETEVWKIFSPPTTIQEEWLYSKVVDTIQE